jgi:hypothetical protein
VSSTTDTEIPATLFLYLVHATDGTSESAD